MDAMGGTFGAIEGLTAFSGQMQSIGGAMASFAASGVEMATTLTSIGVAATPTGTELAKNAASAKALATSLGVVVQGTNTLKPEFALQMQAAVQVGTAWDQLKNKVALLAAQLIGTFGNEIKAVIAGMEGLIGGISRFVTWLGTAPGFLKSVVLFLALLTGGLVAAAAVIAPLIVAVLGVGAVFSSIAIGPLALIIAGVVAAVAAFVAFGSFISGWWKNLGSNGATQANAATMSMSMPFSGLGPKLREALGAALDGMKAAWGMIPQWLRTAVVTLLENLPGVGLAFQAGRRLVEAFGSGIQRNSGRTVAPANAAARNVSRRWEGNSPPPEGPLKDLETGAGNVTDAFAVGIASRASAVSAAGDQLASLLQGSLNLDGQALAAGIALPEFQLPAAAGMPAGLTVPGTTPASTTPTETENAADEDPVKKAGLLDSFFQFDKMVGSVKEKFTGVFNALGPLGVVSTILEGVFKGLEPVIESLKEPLRIVGEILGAALAPILEALFPVFKMIAIAATWVGQIFFTIAGAILTTVGALVKGLGKLISKLPGVGDFGLVKVGDGLINMGKGFKDSAKALAEGREKIKALEFGKTAEATQQTAEAATQANEALRNLPSGFKIALARYQVTTGEPIGLATATLPTGASTGAVAQDNRVTVQGNIVIQGADKDGRQLWEEMQREMQRQSLRQNGTTLGYAVAI